MRNTIEITTTQNVTIEYELASLRERMLAFFLDFLILGFGIFLIFMVLRFLSGGAFMDGMMAVFFFILPFFIFLLYHVLFEILNAGQSPGKMALKLQVVRLDGKELEWSDVLLRALMQLVDSIFSSGVIAALLIRTTEKRQRLGDMAANTTVIQLFSSRFSFRLEDILNISSIDNYQPVYSQVRVLNESDMLFIKMLLVRLQHYPNLAHQQLVEDLVTHLMPILKIDKRPTDRIAFLKTLLRDYIVLTR